MNPPAAAEEEKTEAAPPLVEPEPEDDDEEEEEEILDPDADPRLSKERLDDFTNTMLPGMFLLCHASRYVPAMLAAAAV